MMSDVRDGMIDKVIVYSFSRYARSVTHLLRALDEFKKLSIGFVSITESIDTNTPLGSAVFTILGAVGSEMRALKNEGQGIQIMSKFEIKPTLETIKAPEFQIVRF
jgi:DNA invertase Pin-like site-specific DNA recombinase